MKVMRAIAVLAFTVLIPALAAAAPGVPGIPVGPASGSNSVSYNYTAGPVGNPLWPTCPGCWVSYQWDWDGDGTYDEATAQGTGDGSYSVTTGHIFLADGVYNVRVRSKDDYGGLSAWSPTLVVTIGGPVYRAPGTPSAPTGPSTGMKTDSLSFTVAGVSDLDWSATCTAGHGCKIRYNWDWNGDGTSDESSSYVNGNGSEGDTRAHVFGSDGNYDVAVQAEDDQGMKSAWSVAIAVTIANQAPTVPALAGPTYFGTGYAPLFTAGPSTDPEGHKIRYGWDWDNDSGVDEWTSLVNSKNSVGTNHGWLAAGNYTIQVLAEDQEGTQSGFSIPLNITVYPGSAPALVSGPVCSPTMYTDWFYDFSARATDADMDNILYEWDWDGGGVADYTTGWYSPGATATVLHRFPSTGTWNVKVQAVDSAKVPSGWSMARSVVVSGASMPLDYAVDNLAYSWNTGAAPFIGEGTIFKVNKAAAQAGRIGDGQTSNISTTFNFGQPTVVGFFWKVSSETGDDTFRLEIGGTPVMTISGEQDWAHKTVVVPNGAVLVNWIYSKDGADAGGLDSAWVDRVRAAVFLSATLNESEGPTGTGDLFTVSFTVTNTRSTSVTVEPELAINPGSASATVLSYAGSAAIDASDAHTFVWQLRATRSGTLNLTASVTGLQSDLAETVFVRGSLAVAILPKAYLVGSAAVTPNPAYIGDSVELVLTVTNAGDAACTSITPQEWLTANGLLVSNSGGPTPASVASLAASAKASFTWTFDALGNGSPSWAATAKGWDAGWPGVPIEAAGAATLLIKRPAMLTATLYAALSPVSVGMSCTLVLVASNIGDNDAKGVMPWIQCNNSLMISKAQAGPTPAGPVNLLANGAPASFTWIYGTGASGTARYTATVTGNDAMTKAVVLAANSVNIVQQDPAAIGGSIDPNPAAGSFPHGDYFDVVMAINNKGEAAATNVLPAGDPGTDTCGYAVHKVWGPSPAGPITVPGGSTGRFTWRYEAADYTNPNALCPSTFFRFQGTATGADANSHAGVTTGLFTGNANDIYKAAALRSLISVAPASIREGRETTVRLTVSNVGSLATKAVTPVVKLDPTRLDIGSGPTPATAVFSAAGGGTDVVTFVWTLRARRSGTVSLTASASGEDSVSPGLIRSTASTGSVEILPRFEEQVAVYPNPAPGNEVTIGFRLDDDADTIDVNIYNSAMLRVYTGSWSGVTAVEGAVTITDLRKWAPGVYLVRAKAKLRNGKTQDLPVVRLVVKR